MARTRHSGAAERSEMRAYYEARADTYDDFYHGKGAAVPALSESYPVDTAGCLRLVADACRGHVLDLACGTGFWLQAYGPHCSSVTLIDQSTAVLERCRRRIDALNLRQPATVVQGDVFEVPMPSATFDAVMIGFFLSHLTDDRIARLLTRAREALRPGAVLAVVDSGWSEARTPFCRRDGFEQRPTPDGRSFSIRKRYFTREALDALLRAHGFRAVSSYEGNVFIGVTARMIRPLESQP